MPEPIRVGVAGQGRSGYSIHVQTMAKLRDKFKVVAVADPIEDRRTDAGKLFEGCRGYASTEELIADPEVELIVVATPSYLHHEHAMKAMRAGKGVLCEKPFAFTVKDFDERVAESKKLGKFLAPFQQRRYEPSLAKIQELIAAGTLGHVFEVRVSLTSFMRRWDWQTMKKFGGGQLYNNAPHIIDLALQLFGPADPAEIFCDLQRTLTSGDAEDYVKITLKSPHQPTAYIDLTPANPLGQDLWRVLGTAGAVQGTDKALSWKYVDWSEYPPRPVDPRPTEGRKYNSEPLHFKEGNWELPKDDVGNPVRFYNDLHLSFRESRPLHVSLDSIRRQIAIIEHCRNQCPV